MTHEPKNNKIVVPVTESMKKEIAKFADKDQTTEAQIGRTALNEYMERRRKGEYRWSAWPEKR